MMKLISGAIATLRTLAQKVQVRRIGAIALIGFLVLTTTIEPGRQNQAATRRVDRIAHQTDSQRPKTTGEWNKEAAQDVPLGQRTKDIAEDSAEAFRDFGSLYPDTAKRSTGNAQDS